MAKRLSLITATPAGFNPGMLLTEMLAANFIAKHGLMDRTTFCRFVTLDQRIAGLDRAARQRFETGIAFAHISSMSDLQDSILLFWGDFLHMRQYVQAISQFLPDQQFAEKLLLLRDADEAALSRAISFGSSLIFNSAADLLAPDYGPPLRRFVRGARRILVRDMASAAQVSALNGGGESPLGVDATQLLVPYPDWRAAITSLPPSQALNDPEGGLVFFARSRPNPDVVKALLSLCERQRTLNFSWLPWGDEVAFPFLQEARTSLGFDTHGAPSLRSLLETVAQARLVVTDTYHLAVIAWSLGVPAITLLGQYWARERDVNAGHMHARLDKRLIFHAQHGLLQFLFDEAAAADRSALLTRLNSLSELCESGKVTDWHRENIRARAQWCETQILSAIQSLS